MARPIVPGDVGYRSPVPEINLLFVDTHGGSLIRFVGIRYDLFDDAMFACLVLPYVPILSGRSAGMT